jgi:hypothetical protein
VSKNILLPNGRGTTFAIMVDKARFVEALTKLRHRCPSAFKGMPEGMHFDLDEPNESGLVNLFEDFIRRADWRQLDEHYAQRVNTIFEADNGKQKGVGMVNASMNVRRRALIRALDDLS